MSVVAFAVYVAWDLRFIQIAFHVDRSYLALVITFVSIIGSCHAVWHIVCYSSRIFLAHRILDGHASIVNLREEHRDDMRRHPSILSLSPVHYIGSYVDEIETSVPVDKVVSGGTEELSILEIYADALRSPVEFGWFVVDLSIRLGLIGTIVGFILIFSTLSGNTSPSTDQIQQLLVSMSSGMGTALYTTLFGLVSATILGFQYMILGREVEHLIGLLIRMRNLNGQRR